MVGDRSQQEFDHLGQHDVSLQPDEWDDGERHRYEREWQDQRTAWEREIGRQQLAVAHEANELARTCSYAASDAAAAARSQARTARAALIIATIALFVSIITPENIIAYVASKPWLYWFAQ